MSPRAGKCSSSPSPDDFTFQTKYLVLHFLHQSTTDGHLIPLSQNSVSTTSESEPRFRSYAQRLRQQWQRNRSQSSPTSPQRRTRPKSTKLKGSKSSPDLKKDVHFFKEVRPQRKPKAKQSQPPKAARGGGGRKSSNQSVTTAAAAFIRSVSENTENSETGTYMSDADDELDTSFDSSQQGSTTSVSLRNRLAHYHTQAFRSSLPTVQSETESVTEVPLSVAEESMVAEDSPLPIMDLSANSTDHQPVLTADQYVRVTDYLDRLRETHASRAPDVRVTPSFDAEEEAELEIDGDHVGNEGNGPPEHLAPHADEIAPGQHLLSDHMDDGVVSGGFDPHSTSAAFLDETEGAWGGADEDDVGGNVEPGRRADRSRLRLDICDQDAADLMEVVSSLRQEIEEEISSFESELEEAMQSHHSDYLHLSRSQSLSPETCEIARCLARIGDDVQQKYFDHLDRAVGRLFLDNCAGLFTYERFREAAMMALDVDVQGWRQVATVLLYSQHVALHLAQSGRGILHRVIDYTVRLLADTAADFIVDQGGWASISAMGVSSSPSSPEVTTTEAAPPLELLRRPDSCTRRPPDHHHHTQLSRRARSAPDLHTPPSPAEPHHSAATDHPPPTARHSSPGQVSASSLSMSSSGVVPSQSVPSPSPSQVEKERSGQESGEGSGVVVGGSSDGGGDGTSGEGTAVVSSATLTGWAVSAALIGVGVAVALSLIRG
ncbi:uncharacterized protein LOC143283275 [Babylonia areolata]|uniref:uncharacterized protein LOC143283275 n=1 Tax=Babylonia areolata TaxID=304850 RepID=UPI003FCF759F